MVRRVFVDRQARSAGSLAVLLIGAVWLAVCATPELASFAAGLLPGISPAPLATGVMLLWIAAVLCYSVARSRAEHVFAVEMSQYVRSGEDLDVDVERLAHQKPDEIARKMVQSRERRSIGLPVAAAGILLPATILYAVMAIRSAGYPTVAEFEDALAQHSTPFALCALIGLVVSWAAVRTRLRATSIRYAAGVAAFGLAVGAIAAVPAYGDIALSIVLLGAASVLASVAIIGLRVARESARAAASDPDAGAEVFDIRATLRAFGSGLKRAWHAISVDNAKRLARWTWTHKFRVAVLGGAGAVAVLLLTPANSTVPKQELVSSMLVQGSAASVDTPLASHEVALGMKSPNKAYDAHLDPAAGAFFAFAKPTAARTEVELKVPGVAYVQPGWALKLELRLVGDRAPSSASLRFANDADSTVLDGSAESTMLIQNCSAKVIAVPKLAVTHGEESAAASLALVPSVTLAQCD